ncbi:MAG: 50S ribosomal protein L17 [Desulfobacteraceae bacterium]|nr:MAG: 50S ribosomal protein L17 [Desulfobacteraceae bacterium]
MRHRNAGIKLGKTSSHRDAMFRNMVTSLLKHDRIRTTDVKAKELRRWADKIITLAKQGDLHSRRQALAIVREKDVVHKLFAEAADRFGSISGGYTRIVKDGNRPGDAAPVSIVELVAPEKSKKKEDKKKKPKVSAKKKSAASKKGKVVKKEKTAPAPAESPAAPAEEKA